MSESKRNILVGLMSIAGLGCLGVILLLFGYTPQWLENGYVVSVELNQAAGLTPGSRIKLSGIDIGRVWSIRLQNPPNRGVLVEALIDDDIALPEAARIGVEAPILGGSPSLAFHIGVLDDEQLNRTLATDGSARVQGTVPSLATKFAEEMKAALAEPFMRFEQFSDRWTRVADHLIELTEPRSPTEVDAGRATGNLHTILARTDARLTELKQTIGHADAWLTDEQLQSDVRAAAARSAAAMQKLDHAADRARQFIDGATRLVVGTDKHLGSLTKRYIAVADDMGRALGKLQNVLDKADAGQGSMGKVLNDPALYNNLNDTLQRMIAAIKEMQLLIEKWKKEGVPVQL